MPRMTAPRISSPRPTAHSASARRSCCTSLPSTSIEARAGGHLRAGGPPGLDERGLPGGWVGANERLEEALARELRELIRASLAETGTMMR